MPKQANIPRVCVQCGQTFFVTYPSKTKRHCSRACVGAAQAGDWVARFWSKVDQSGGPDACWPWMASRDELGYGFFSLRGRMVKTHRLAYTLSYGPIPEGIDVCHGCDYPPCCNPRCLWPGTDATNSEDKVLKGRQHRPRGERNPRALLTETQVHEVRRRHAAGEAGRAIATDLGVGEHVVRFIVRGLTWRHVH